MRSFHRQRSGKRPGVRRVSSLMVSGGVPREGRALSTKTPPSSTSCPASGWSGERLPDSSPVSQIQSYKISRTFGSRAFPGMISTYVQCNAVIRVIFSVLSSSSYKNFELLCNSADFLNICYVIKISGLLAKRLPKFVVSQPKS